MKSKVLAVLILASLMYGLTGAVNAIKAGFDNRVSYSMQRGMQ
jgi:hypothetical protein